MIEGLRMNVVEAVAALIRAANTHDLSQFAREHRLKGFDVDGETVHPTDDEWELAEVLGEA
jgi:hypothetical protein